MIRQVVTIDGTPFDVGVAYIKRQARITDGPNAGEAKRGDWIRDVYGTFYDYILAFDTSAGLSKEDYDTTSSPPPWNSTRWWCLTDSLHSPFMRASPGRRTM